jgi:hypothetical protein
MLRRNCRVVPHDMIFKDRNIHNISTVRTAGITDSFSSKFHNNHNKHYHLSVLLTRAVLPYSRTRQPPRGGNLDGKPDSRKNIKLLHITSLSDIRNSGCTEGQTKRLQIFLLLS